MSSPEVPPPHGLVAVFKDGETALMAVSGLLAAGIPHERIAFVGKDEGALRAGLTAIGFPVGASLERPADLAAHLEPPHRDPAVGFLLGGVAGLLVGLGPFFMPLFGPMLLSYGGLAIAAEALTASAVGAGVGAALGSFFEHDVAARHRARWQAALKADGWLVVLHGDPGEVERAEAVLAAFEGVHADTF